MRRTQIQLDDEVYERLRAAAHHRHTSMAALVRDALRAHLGLGPERQQRDEDFGFVGSGRTEPDPARGAVSERHDEAFAEALP